jgi:hypothetical protein
MVWYVVFYGRKLSVPYRLSTPAYMLQAKIKGNAYAHALARATAAP